MHESASAKATRQEKAGLRLVRALIGVGLIAAIVGAVPVIGICQPLSGSLPPMGPVMRFMAWVDPVFATAPEVREMQRTARNRMANPPLAQPLAQPQAIKAKQPEPQVGMLAVKQGTLLARKI